MEDGALLSSLKDSLDHLETECSLLDPEFKILWINQAKKRKRPQLEQGSHCWEAFEFGAPCPFCLASQVVQLKETVKNAVKIDKRGLLDDHRHINVILTPVFDSDGVLSGYIEYIDNVEKLFQVNQRLERLNKEYENVIYALSHDLRAPLVSIEGFLRKLITGHITAGDNKADHYVKRIEANIEMMSNLVKVLLDTSRIVTGRFDLQENDVGVIVDAVIQQYGLRAQERGAKIVKTGVFGTETCDKVRIIQVFSNLVNNVFQHCRDTKNLRIEIGCDKGVYRVADNGPGIPEEVREKVFEPFTQGESGGKDSFGMGMNILYKIVRKHHGKVWFETETGKGTTVFFTLKHGED